MELHETQNIVASDTHRFRVLNAGRGWGKTALSVEEIIGYAVAKTGKVLYLAPTIKQARDICWQTLKERAKPIIKKANESRLEIELVNVHGKISTVYLRGWEAIESLRGQEFEFIVIDEVASMRNFFLGWEEVLRPTLRISRGPVLFISTPKGYNHFFDLYQMEKKNKDFKSFHYTSYDNPHIQKAEIESAKKDLPQDRFEQEYMGSFQKAEGLVYPEFYRQRHMIVEDPTHVVETMLGVDFGYTNPTCVLTIKRDIENNYYITNEWYKWGKTNIEVIEYCKSVKHNSVYADPAEPDRIKEMKRHGLYCKEVSKAVSAGIDVVRELLKAERLFIHERCRNLISEIETYHYPESKEDRNDDEKPVKENDHAMDAMRYVFMAKHGGGTKRKPYIPNHKVYRF